MVPLRAWRVAKNTQSVLNAKQSSSPKEFSKEEKVRRRKHVNENHIRERLMDDPTACHPMILIIFSQPGAPEPPGRL